MRTSSRINIIGILCIIFGGLGIISNILEIALLELPIDRSPVSSPEAMGWVISLAYIGLVVDAIYVIAGILFLVKKSYSIKFIYSALVISIVYEIVPLLILSDYPPNPYFYYEFNVSSLIGPFIDVALIVAVIRVSKKYFMPVEENSMRRTLTLQKLRVYSLLGVLCLSIPISLIALWIYAANSATTFEGSVALFRSYIPTFLHGYGNTPLFSVVFCIAAIILSSVCIQTTVKLWKVVNIVVLTLSILSLLLNIFQMM